MIDESFCTYILIINNNIYQLKEKLLLSVYFWACTTAIIIELDGK